MRSQHRPPPQFPDLVYFDAAILRPYDQHIGMGTTDYRPAIITLITRAGMSGAAQSPGHFQGQGSLANPIRSSQQISIGDIPLIDARFQ